MSPAFTSLDGTASYAAFDADIDRVAGVLAAVPGIRPGALTAVQATNPYLHWLVLLALARLGIASCPAVPEMPATVLLTDRPEKGGDVLLSVEWTRAALLSPRPDIPVCAVEPSSSARLMSSSGTTGTRKLISYSWHGVDSAAKAGLVACANMPLRMMVMTGTDTLMGFTNLLSAWYGGGTVLAAPLLADLPDVLPRLAPTVLVMATGQLAVFLPRLPDDYAPPPGLHVGVAGSLLSPDLARRAVAALRCELTTTYGATEAGLVAVMQAGAVASLPPDAVGFVAPWKVVQVVDAAGRPVAPGEEGEIRIRGADVVAEYLGDPEASRAAFRDGWFHPGDIGRLRADGLLRVSGRVDEVINTGGVKFLPATLELAAATCPGVAEAACFAVKGEVGPQKPYLAVVRGPGFDVDALAAALRGAVRGIMPRVVWVEAIPKNAMGKPDRTRLAAAVTSQAQPEPGGWGQPRPDAPGAV